MTFILVNSYWLALCIYHEARGEAEIVQIGVAHTVMNRCLERRMSVKDIVQEPDQFAWYDNQYVQMNINPNTFEQSILVAKKCLEQRMNGETWGGVNHFHDDSISPPDWTENMVHLGKFGRMHFYKG